MNILPDDQMQWEDSNGIKNSAANPYLYLRRLGKINAFSV